MLSYLLVVHNAMLSLSMLVIAATAMLLLTIHYLYNGITTDHNDSCCFEFDVETVNDPGRVSSSFGRIYEEMAL